MQRIVCLVCLVWVLAVASVAPGCHPAATGTTPGATSGATTAAAIERELRALDQQWAELAVRGDAAAFDRLVTGDHVATHASGKLVTNAEERSYLATSPAHIASITTDDVAIAVYGDTAVIHGVVTVKTRNGGGGAYRYTTVWLHRGGAWRIVTEQHTKIDPAAVASASPPAAAGAAGSSGPPTPEQVVRAYVKACNELDLPALVALHSADVRKFARSDEAGAPAAGKAPGEFVMTTSGRDEVERKYQRLFARTASSVHVEVVGVFTLGDLVVSRDRVSGFPDGHVAEELAMYQVRDGLIRAIWYLGQVKQ
jgi:ketosteroid isomerase-like protein